MFKFSTVLFALFFSVASVAQTQGSFWEKAEKTNVNLPENALRPYIPTEYEAVRLDFEALRRHVGQAPDENAKASPLVVALPMADGSMENFAVVESSLMPAALQARWPEMRSYRGYSLGVPGKTMRMSITPYGFHATIIRPDKGLEYIEPIAKNQTAWYMVYDRVHFPDELRPKVARTTDFIGQSTIVLEDELFAPKQTITERGFVDPEKLHIYRFACAATAEFSQDHGGTTPSVLAAMVNYLETLNAIYETELAIRLIFVDNVERILFLNANAPGYPYSGTTVGGWMSQNPNAMGLVLGGNNYDLGHVFARYMGGDAIGVAGGLACDIASKGRGCSAGIQGVYGDGFLGVIGQEIGHQWSGGHTWNRCLDNTQFNYGVACEPGSGSTIMSYAGACGPDNVQNDMDLYYNICSIIEIKRWVHIGAGKDCGQSVVTDNHPPVVSHNYANNFFIPIKTPFELDGTATDQDGDALTYCWEQVDVGAQQPLGVPVGSSPAFRTYPPSTKTNRVFPRIQSIIANQSPKTEVLVDYSRDFTFALTARDGRDGGGGVGYKEVAFRTTTDAGPFLVLEPNTNTARWEAGSCAEVRWDVANTDKAPVNCKVVNIRLSTDGGLTYPVTLANNVPNNGLATVLVPTGLSTQGARIRVDAGDNIFFDISNANFTIGTAAAPALSLCLETTEAQVCLPNSFVTEIAAQGVGGFSGNVSYSILGLPAGATATFSPQTATPGVPTTLTIDVRNVTVEGVYDLTVKAESGATSLQKNLRITTVSNNFSALAVVSPADGAINVAQGPTLNFTPSPDAIRYEIQLATNPAFLGSQVLSQSTTLTTGSYTLPVLLGKGKTYYWRVRPVNECGTGPWIPTAAFTTESQSCSVFPANDLPILIGNTPVTVESKINVLAPGIVSDINVRKISGNHVLFNNLTLTLIGPDGSESVLVKNKCPQTATFNLGFDDDAPTLVTCPPSNAGTAYKPQIGALSIFNGKASQGQWTLRINDNEFQAGGQIAGFELEICGSLSLNAPILINNLPLTVNPGNNHLITSTLLKAEDADNNASELVFTLVTAPLYGHLAINGTILQVGDTWTQADIDAGNLRFYDYGNTTVPSDGFRFTITDGAGGFYGTPTFVVLHMMVGVENPALEAVFGGVSLNPNPATDVARLTFDRPLESSTELRIVNVAGQLIQQQLLGEGQTAAAVSVNKLPSGLYFLILSNEKGRAALRLVVE